MGVDNLIAADALGGVINARDATGIDLISEIKPILRPLSQLVEEITHDGKTFVPLAELAKMVYSKPWKISKETTPSNYIVDFQESIIVDNGRQSMAHHFGWQKHGEYFFCSYGGVRKQHHLLEKLYSWHFWAGDQTYFEKGLLIQKPAK